MSLASLDTAVRVREVIKRQAMGAIDRGVPKSLIGRVVSLDLARQTARVWFTGDEQPVQVKLFSSTIPGKWQSQLQPGMTISTNLSGYGSMVSCQRLNGELYITDVLTGGQFSYDLVTMNQKFVSTYPYSFSPNSVFGQVIAAKTHCTIVADATIGQAVEFGPFVKLEGTASSQWVKIDIDFSSGSSAYEFNLSLGQFTDGSNDLDRWFRILPCRETSANLSSQVDYYDLDVCIRQTPYGLEPDFNTQKLEYWFRLVKRDDDSSSISADISFETNLFDKPRSVDGNERLVQTVVTRPKEIAGYVGFHNSEMNVFDLYDVKIRDRYNRDLTTTWGTADDDTTWTLFGGVASNYSVTNNKGVIKPTSTNVTYSQVNSRSEYDFDCVVNISPSHVATTFSVFAYVFVRRTASNNYYRFRLEFTTAGQINLIIGKVVLGTSTTLQSASSVMAYSAGGTYSVRGQLRNSALRMKIWSGATEPAAWNLTHASDTAITGAGSLALAAFRGDTNTNNDFEMSFSELECNVSSQARFSAGGWATGPYRSTVLRTGNELQKTWTCTSGFTWDNTNSALGWGDKILFSGIGRHRNGLSQGIMYLTCPKNVTEYVIPVFGNATPTTIAVHANGVVLAAGRSLYVAIPPGERNVDLIENLFLVDSSTDGVEFQLPEWAVLIAHRQAGTSLIRLGNGEWAGAESVEIITTDSSAATANGSYSATAGFSGSTTCGTTFIAPQSGRVDIKWSGEISNVSSFSLLSIEVRTGATIGSGTVLFGPDDNHTARSDTPQPVGSHQSKMITGLTPGSVYNVRTMHRTNGTNGVFGRRKIWVHPAS